MGKVKISKVEKRTLNCGLEINSWNVGETNYVDLDISPLYKGYGEVSYTNYRPTDGTRNASLKALSAPRWDKFYTCRLLTFLLS